MLVAGQLDIVVSDLALVRVALLVPLDHLLVLLQLAAQQRATTSHSCEFYIA